MPTGEFVDRLVAHTNQPKTINERLWHPPGWKKEAVHLPHPINTQSLTAVRDFVKSDLDGLAPTELMIHVQTPTEITVLSRILDDEWDDMRRRICYLTAVIEHDHPFGTWMDAEDFIVWIMTRFDPGSRQKELLELVGSLKAENVLSSEDDGYSQEVVAKSGIASVAAKKVQNPVSLQPYRTFPEVWQPPSDFIVRFRSTANQRPMIALFEGDGGAWRGVAMRTVKTWLEKEIPGVLILA